MSDSSDPGLSQLDWGKIEKISDMDLKQMLAYQTGFDQENVTLDSASMGGLTTSSSCLQSLVPGRSITLFGFPLPVRKSGGRRATPTI